MPGKLTLMDLLNARENRVFHQKQLLSQYPGSVLVSMTLNIPGPVKDRPEYRKALESGLHRLKAILPFAILCEEFRPLVTGPEAYLAVSCSSDSMSADSAENMGLLIKKITVSIEEDSPLGRLFDMDVLIDKGSPLPYSISRSQLGAAPRRCLLCGENAKACARSRAHPMDQLLKKIDEILADAGI